MNLYAAPKAKLEKDTELGTVWRQGKLVRLERAGALPDRCVICNAAAGGARVSRKLYWSPTVWRVSVGLALFGIFALGLSILPPVLILFWPLVIILIVANFFVRKSITLDMGICTRHRRIRDVVRALSIACVVGVVAGIPMLGDGLGAALLAGSILGLLGLVIAQSLLGVQAIFLKRLTSEHAWLARTGAAFRGELPELH